MAAAQTPAPMPTAAVAGPSTAPKRAAQKAASHALFSPRAGERAALLVSDLACANLSFYLAWFARYRLELVRDLEPGNFVPHEVYIPLQVGLSLVFVAILALRGLYRLPRGATALDDASPIFTATGLALMVVFAASTFVRYPAESRLALIFTWVLMTVLVTLGRAVCLAIFGRLHEQGVGVVRTLVVGDNTSGRMIMQGLAARPHLGYQVVGFLSDGAANDFGRFQRLGSHDTLEHVVREQGIEHVVVALPSTSHEAILRIVDHCRRDNVEFRVVPDLYEMSLGQVDMDMVTGIPLLGLKRSSISGLNLLLKRGIDLGIALSLLPFLGPLCLLIAVAIKLDDPSGPVFFGQTRVGRGGRQFAAWKFRSMRTDADELLETLLDQNETRGPTFKMRDDPRCTRVGRLLRRASLDELPQIWNIFRGDMSLVGPRPPTPREVALYEDWHHQRLQALPGLTGLWQVSGRSQLGFDEMVMLDITYIENWSIGLDLRILLRTIPTVLMGKGAF